MEDHKLLAKRRRIILVAAIVILIGLAMLSVQIIRHRSKSKKPVSSGVVTHSADKPDEEPITPKTYTWSGAPVDPKFIDLPSIGDSGFVQQVGVDQNHQIAVPTNIHLAGWFSSSVHPGDKGLAIIDGHVDGYRLPGIFVHLAKLKVNDKFTLQLGSGKSLTYKVLKVSSVATADAAGILFSQDPTVASQLNLVTCGGNFNKASHEYDNRVIVAASLISS